MCGWFRLRFTHLILQNSLTFLCQAACALFVVSQKRLDFCCVWVWCGRHTAPPVAERQPVVTLNKSRSWHHAQRSSDRAH
ncbi:hypothetical protein FOA52_008747 [Chlamydomonas sp. UWO 241]|nr:hypothetical protein FOA52_008747 [Chlamydomonas sp. UWO 241]